jgi:PAS domain S-box-containing protein
MIYFMVNDTPSFDSYFNNARLNSMLIMELDGTILDVNQAFTNNFGYPKKEIKSKNFSILFTQADRDKKLPQQELERVIATGQSTDENYIINSSGLPIWAIGESLLVTNKDGQKYIVKDMVNLQAKKQLQLFLMETEELLGRIFESSKDVPMMMLNGSLKLIKVNPAFLSLFELKEAPPSGSRLTDIPHPFWQQGKIKKEVSSIIINNKPLKHQPFQLQSRAGETKVIKMDSRTIEGHNGAERKIFILMEEETA